MTGTTKSGAGPTRNRSPVIGIKRNFETIEQNENRVDDRPTVRKIVRSVSACRRQSSYRNPVTGRRRVGRLLKGEWCRTKATGWHKQNDVITWDWDGWKFEIRKLEASHRLRADSEVKRLLTAIALAAVGSGCRRDRGIFFEVILCLRSDCGYCYHGCYQKSEKRAVTFLTIRQTCKLVGACGSR